MRPWEIGLSTANTENSPPPLGDTSPISPQFYRLDGIYPDESLAGNVKEFKGDGTPYLRVPGLKELLGVRIESMEIPLTEVRKHPVNQFMNEFARTEIPNVAVQVDHEGIPVLLRAVHSNDGIWQEGARIFITGNWDEDDAASKRKAA